MGWTRPSHLGLIGNESNLPNLEKKHHLHANHYEESFKKGGGGKLYLAKGEERLVEEVEIFACVPTVVGKIV